MTIQDMKTKSKSRRFIPFYAAIFVAAVAIACFVPIGLESPNSSVADGQTGKVQRASTKDYGSFREDVKRRDQELLAKWRKIKQDRRKPQEPGHARRDYEKRLADLESALELNKDSVDHEGSIGWGLKQDIAKLKSDPPPLN